MENKVETYFNVHNGKYDINEMIKEVTDENNKFYTNLSLSNFFIVKMPKELDINATDIISFEFTKKKTCKIVLRDNFENFPLFTVNEYIDKKEKEWFFNRTKDNITVEYLSRTGSIEYTSILEDISINRVLESKLTYDNDSFHTITLEITFKKRILNRHGSTDKE